MSLSELSKANLTAAGVDHRRVVVIPNSVDQSLLESSYDKGAIRRELGLSGATLVGTVPSLVQYEGIVVLIRALKILPTNIEVLIVGDGNARSELETLASDLDLDTRVHFAGRQPHKEIWKWYAALDLFALPRIDAEVRRSVTPLKPLIAMALGVPVVASDLPAIREVTGNFANYVEPESISELAEGISRALAAGRQDSSQLQACLHTRTWQNQAETLKLLYRSQAS